MQTYTKTIKLGFDIDKSSVASVKSIIDGFKKLGSSIFSGTEESVKKIKETVASFHMPYTNVAPQASEIKTTVPKQTVIDKTETATEKPQIKKDSFSADEYAKLFENLKRNDMLDSVVEEIREYDKAIEKLIYLQSMFKETFEQQGEIAERARAQLADMISEQEDIVKSFEKKRKGLDDDDESFSDWLQSRYKLKPKGSAKDTALKVGVQLLEKAIDAGIKALKTVLSDAWDELKTILSYSRLTDPFVREQAFTYGFTMQENYAFSKTTELLGISSQEDLMYMNETQRNKFIQKFNEYADKYQSLYNSGFFNTLEEYSWEMAEFREDMEYEVINFFMENKDTIRQFMLSMMEFAKFAVQALGWLVEGLVGVVDRSQSSKNAATADILNTYSITNTSNTANTNITIDNTFNNVAKEDRTWLANAGAMTYEQIIRALR